MTKNRFPIIKRDSDECEIDIAGEKIRPHIGESVYFIPYLSVGKALKLTEAMDKISNSDMDIIGQLRIIANIADILAQVIDHWNWTHPITGENIGAKMGKEYKPDSEAIQELGADEVSFLINEFFGVMSPEENPPPASSE